MSSSHEVGRLFGRPGLRAQQTQGRKLAGVVRKSAGNLTSGNPPKWWGGSGHPFQVGALAPGLYSSWERAAAGSPRLHAILAASGFPRSPRYHAQVFSHGVMLTGWGV